MVKIKKIEEPERTFGGHRRFDKSIYQEKNEKNIIYSRVSSYGQKEDLARQTKAIKYFTTIKEVKNIEIIEDIGSGLNYNKKGFKRLLKMIVNQEIEQIFIQNKDRLSRFGIGIIQAFAKEFGAKIVIINEREQTFENKLMYDLMSLLTSFSGSIHGRRSHKNKVN